MQCCGKSHAHAIAALKAREKKLDAEVPQFERLQAKSAVDRCLFKRGLNVGGVLSSHVAWSLVVADSEVWRDEGADILQGGVTASVPAG